MIRIFNVREAQEFILKRRSLDDMPFNEAILDGIEAVFGERKTPDEAVRRILHDVRFMGDAGVQKWSGKLDNLDVNSFLVNSADISLALEIIPRTQRKALEIAIERIRRFYSHQPLSSWIMQEKDGILGQLVRPIKRVGLYIPGGSAPLPSTILMSVIPAQIAGVKEIALVVPPKKGTQKIAPITLAAAALLDLDEIYTVGGAQAIGALAFGTESIPAVDKIFGPGNIFVTLAKRQVFGTVGIDGLAGPTETMIISDESSRPEWVAADLLAQAEHDSLASAILLTSSQRYAKSVQSSLQIQLESLPRSSILSQSLNNRSGIVITKDLEESIELANRYAPEHLCLSVADPWAVSEKITACGGIFMGEFSCEVLGDYVAGPSHVMPTSGTARFASPLNLLDFVHFVSLIALNSSSASSLADHAAVLARAEELEAHARAAVLRKNDGK